MYIEVGFFTLDHLIEGYVETPEERLSDLLNLKNETAIIMRDVKISRLLSSNEPPLEFPSVRVEKNQILLAHPVEKDLTSKSIYRRATRRIFPVTVIMPSFEVTGQIHMTEQFEIRRVLLSRPEDFIPLTESILTYTPFPSVSVRLQTLIFNKSRMILIGERPIFNTPGTTPKLPPQVPNS